MITQTQAYLTSNGELFLEEGLANQRQQELDVKGAVGQNGKPAIDAISSLIALKGYTLGNYISHRLESTSADDLILELQDKIEDLDNIVGGNP